MRWTRKSDDLVTKLYLRLTSRLMLILLNIAMRSLTSEITPKNQQLPRPDVGSMANRELGVAG
jgi:hypothetical protein